MKNDLKINQYFSEIEKEVKKLYEVASEARSRGIDPRRNVEIYQAKDLASRVEGLIGLRGLAHRIRELNRNLSREEIAFKIAEEIVRGKFQRFSDEEAAELAVRTALAILTEGITAAPLQGIDSVKVKRNFDGTNYLAIYFAGPIRSAGGTEQALTVLIGDFVRKLLHLDKYKPTVDEVNRFIEELRLYERKVSRFQFHFSDDEIRDALVRIPIEITGPPTDPFEVSVYRNLKRIETNRVRGGALRVLNDGVLAKAAKLKKTVDKLGISGWDWLRGREREIEAGTSREAEYLYDLVGGRPILSQPSRIGGFRLRYGRCRNTGLAAIGLHPATMAILEGFIAIGTQLRIEKPGKSAIIMPVDSICGPIVKLNDGSVIELSNEEEALAVKKKIKQILFLGDMLIGYGEFLENNHNLLPAGYCEEMWAEEVKKKIDEKGDGALELTIKKIGAEKLKSYLSNPLKLKPSAIEALEISKALNVPLHPKFALFFENVTPQELLYLRDRVIETYEKHGESLTSRLIVDLRPEVKKILEKLGCPHAIQNNEIVLAEDLSVVLMELLALNRCEKLELDAATSFELIEKLSGIKIRAKGGTFIGARMGRPEKAKPRLMKPPVHVLFPVGLSGGATRDVVKASGKDLVEAEVSARYCNRCNNVTHSLKCEKCGEITRQIYVCPICKGIYEKQVTCCGAQTRPYCKRLINIKSMLSDAIKRVGFKADSIKGVKGLISNVKMPEPLEKGLLRAKHGVYVYKDGTVRFDVTNAPLTHFKPREIKASVQKLRELGYTEDCDGKALTDEDQIVELKPQDVIIPLKCAEYLYKTGMFIDELLEKVYNTGPYYKFKSLQDLIGHLIVGIAPHTSAGVIGRVIGFTSASVCYAHPYWHAAKRRNCDGDEDAVMLALDALINFSKDYLPEKRGGLMDAPLVVTTIVDPAEVDDESHNIETMATYPLEFYMAAEHYADPRECLKIVQIVKHKLGKTDQYEGFKYLHEVEDLEKAPKVSSYTKLKSMLDKVRLQLSLAEKISAVDVYSVVEGVLKHHFIPDLVGNLRAFLNQEFRCKKCGRRHRRVPLNGKCKKCGGELSLTVFEGAVVKYLSTTLNLVKDHEISTYLKQNVELIKKEMENLFKQFGGKMALDRYM